MRALYKPELQELIEKNQEEFKIEGDDFHHLARVVRIKLADEVLILLGEGNSFQTSVVEINKKYLLLQKASEIFYEDRPHMFSLAVGITHPDTIKKIIYIVCELGFYHLYFVQTEYSSHKMVNEKKINLLLKMGMEQSNSKYKPRVELLPDLKSLLALKKIVYFCHNAEDSLVKADLQFEAEDQEKIILVGPEGGFSLREQALLLNPDLSLINNSHHVQKVSLKTPIMRTETAVATCLGFLLQFN